MIEASKSARSILAKLSAEFGTSLLSGHGAAQIFYQIYQSAGYPRAEFSTKYCGGGVDYYLRFMNLRILSKHVFLRESILVLIRVERPDPLGVLKDRYGLTRSERRVAMALADGLSVKSIAERFKIDPNTVRAHLKMAYDKTNMRSQSQLASFIGRLSRDLR